MSDTMLGWLIVAAVPAAMVAASLLWSRRFNRLTPAEQEKRKKRWSAGGGSGGGNSGCGGGCGGGGE
jgi:hypothetical protein